MSHSLHEAAGTSSLFATAASDPKHTRRGLIGLWDAAGRKVGAFRSPWSPGGRRLCIVDGVTPTIVTAAYHVDGIAAHAQDGSPLWHGLFANVVFGT